MTDPLRHHGDAEIGDGLVDFAVNVYDGPRPAWLDAALRSALADVGRYPSAAGARDAVAAHHRRDPAEVLVTAGAAEAFTLIARARPWRRPVVVHPQFTEPHAALEQAGHRVDPVILREPFRLEPTQVPADADLVIVGNPTNPTGVLHPAATLRSLLRPGRVVIVDEAFIDCVPDARASLADTALDGLVVLRSLTKHWSIPGIRAGYLLAPPDLVADLAAHQVPWSVGTLSAAAVTACVSPVATLESRRRAERIVEHRTAVEKGLADLGIGFVGSAASFVLARPGVGVRERLRAAGIAVRRADTFPGLDDSWVRIAVRGTPMVEPLFAALADALG